MIKLLLFVSLLSFNALAEDIPGASLLSYFQANCRSQGEWTKAALQDSISLANTLRDISKDPDCQSVGGAVAGLTSLSAQLSELDKLSNTQNQIARLNAQEQELMVLLSQTTNPTVVDQANTTLLNIQVERAGYLSEEKSQKDFMTPSKVQILTGLITTANSTFTQLAANQRCIAKNPNVLDTATSIMASVGATASVVNPALGLGLTAGAVVLGTTVEGLRQVNLNRRLKNLSDGTIAEQAYACALETMGDRWCQMRDAESFLNFKANARLGDLSNMDLAKAVRLADREIPVILEWLNLIKSGVSPVNTADANRRNQVLFREAAVRASESTGIGLIEQERNNFNAAVDRDAKWNILRSIINTLAPPYNVFSGSQSEKSPLQDILAREYAPFFLLGLPDDSKLQDANGNYYTLANWPGRLTYVPDLDLTKAQYIAWIERARLLVNQELTQVLQPDSLQTLSVAFDRSNNRWKTSPMDAIKTIITFLETNPPRNGDVIFNKVYASTLNKLRDIYGITMDAVVNWNEPNRFMKLNDPLPSITPPILAQTPIERIYDKASLQFGTVVIQSRLEMIVRISVLELLRTSPPKDQVLVAQLLAANRFTETLSRMSGENLSRVRQDIDNARPVTISNLNTFADLFGKNITRILARLYGEMTRSTGSVSKAKQAALTKLCHHLLAVPDVLSYVNVSYCQGLRLVGEAGGPSTDPLSYETFKKDLNDRACVQRDFFRDNKIFEDWRNQP